jgi:putative transposase
LVSFSLVYLVVCRLLQLIVMRTRPNADRDLELLVLRHENTVLRRQVRRVTHRTADRLLLAAVSRVLPGPVGRRSW